MGEISISGLIKFKNYFHQPQSYPDCPSHLYGIFTLPGTAVDIRRDLLPDTLKNEFPA